MSHPVVANVGRLRRFHDGAEDCVDVVVKTQDVGTSVVTDVVSNPLVAAPVQDLPDHTSAGLAR